MHDSAEDRRKFRGHLQDKRVLKYLREMIRICRFNNRRWVRMEYERAWESTITINLTAQARMIRSCIPHLAREGAGRIVNIASTVSKIAVKDRFAYGMSKGAVLTMTLSVARDFIDRGIRCNCVCPARVHTPFVDGYIAKNYPGQEKEMFQKLSQTQPIGRMGAPEEVASLALFLCSDEAAFITGVNYPIDGGFLNLRD